MIIHEWDKCPIKSNGRLWRKKYRLVFYCGYIRLITKYSNYRDRPNKCLWGNKISDGAYD